MKRLFLLGIIVFMVIFPQTPSNSSTNSSTVKVDYYRLYEARKEMKIMNLEQKIQEELDIFCFNLSTKSERSERFINKLKDDAINGTALPSIVISQAAIETGFGRSTKLGNNIFGIKGKGYKVKTKEWDKSKRRYITINSEFQYFKTISDAMDRHYEIISRNEFDSRDYVEWAIKIKQGGYATDPKYAYKLIKIVEDYELDRLDRIQELKCELIEIKENNNAIY